MITRHFEIISFIIICFFLSIIRSNAQDTTNDKHIEVALRMIGHQILLNSADTASRVLPIIKESNQYRIQFESELVFNPENLVSTISNVIKETRIAKNYIVEVEQCETTEVVYSFEIDALDKSDIIPCSGRVHPKSCYNILFTIIEYDKINATLVNTDSDESKPETNLGVYIITFGLFILLFLVIFFLMKRPNKTKADPNMIPLGTYFFDKKNTELIIDHQKIELTSKEADLLLLLYNAANTTVERNVILNMVWGDEGDYIGRTVDVFISKLRKKLEFDSKVKIVNVRGVGYKLVMD